MKDPFAPNICVARRKRSEVISHLCIILIVHGLPPNRREQDFLVVSWFRKGRKLFRLNNPKMWNEFAWYEWKK